MEIPVKYIDAYRYYKRMRNTEKNMSRDAVITTVARMFAIPNTKDFHSYVLRMDKNEERGFFNASA